MPIRFNHSASKRKGIYEVKIVKEVNGAIAIEIGRRVTHGEFVDEVEIVKEIKCLIAVEICKTDSERGGIARDSSAQVSHYRANPVCGDSAARIDSDVCGGGISWCCKYGAPHGSASGAPERFTYVPEEVSICHEYVKGGAVAPGVTVKLAVPLPQTVTDCAGRKW